MSRIKLALAGCCVVLIAAVSVSGCTADRSTASASRASAREGNRSVITSPIFSTVIKMSPAELKLRAQVIVKARVVRRVGPFSVQEPAGDDGSTMTRVFTDWEVMPLRVYKTDGRVSQGSPIRVALFGGEADGVKQIAADEVDLTAGETVVLFLTREISPEAIEEGRYGILTLAQGKYHVDDSTGRAENPVNKTVPLKELESLLLTN